MATIGKHRAIAETGKLRLTGYVAWVAWLFIHIFYLIGFKNRATVFAEWTWNYLFSQRGARLSDSPSVNAWVSSCHAVDPQLKSPRSRADGASIASTGPKLTPSAPSPVRPTVRTEKSAWRRYSSRRTGVAGR